MNWQLAIGNWQWTPSPLPPMSEQERLVADYAGSGLTIGPHPMSFRRHELSMRGVLRAIDLPRTRAGRRVRTAGMVITRQRPGTAKGFVFLTLEDETGLSNAVLTPDMASRFRVPLHQAALLEIAGPLQRVEGVLHVRAREVRPLALVDLADEAKLPPSHDYR